MGRYVVLAALAGLVLPVQVFINSRLSGYLSGPLSATAVSGCVAAASLIAVFFLGEPGVSLREAANAPWWAWTGGLIGGFFLLATLISAPRLGVAGTMSLLIAGQLISSLALDHFGVMQASQPLNLPRLAGAGLLAVGAFLILNP